MNTHDLLKQITIINFHFGSTGLAINFFYNEEEKNLLLNPSETAMLMGKTSIIEGWRSDYFDPAAVLYVESEGEKIYWSDFTEDFGLTNYMVKVIAGKWLEENKQITPAVHPTIANIINAHFNRAI